MLHRLTSSRIGRNSLYTIAGQLSLTLLQALQFFVIARALGPHEFGRVASVIAITSMLLPFSGLGLGNIAIKRLARGQGEAAMYLGNGVFVATVTGLVAVMLAVVAGGNFLNDSSAWLLIALFGVSEILLTKYTDIAAHVLFGLERQRAAVAIVNLHMLIRLAFAAGLYYFVSAPSALQWAVLHLTGGLLTLMIVMTATVKGVGRPVVKPKLAWSDARQGVFFSVTLSSRSVCTDIDKAVLARFGPMDVTGAYTAAYRLVYMAYMPVIAALFAVQSRMFRDGAAGGLEGTRAFAARLGLMGSAYCIMLAVLIYGFAPLVPWLLGDAYALSSDVMRALCLLPLLLMIQSVCSEALNGADAQNVVAGIHAAGAVASLLLNLLLVPMLSWQGAVYAAYGTQVLLVVGVIAASVRIRRRGPKPAAAVGTPAS
jgi:O-antigen/teichoic acid export membrane protein